MDRSHAPFDPTAAAVAPPPAPEVEFGAVEARYTEIKKTLKNSDGFWESLPPAEPSAAAIDSSAQSERTVVAGYSFQKEETPYSEAYHEFGTDKYFN